jgi:hypothetical protein
MLSCTVLHNDFVEIIMSNFVIRIYNSDFILICKSKWIKNKIKVQGVVKIKTIEIQILFSAQKKVVQTKGFSFYHPIILANIFQRNYNISKKINYS